MTAEQQKRLDEIIERKLKVIGPWWSQGKTIRGHKFWWYWNRHEKRYEQRTHESDICNVISGATGKARSKDPEVVFIANAPEDVDFLIKLVLELKRENESRSNEGPVPQA